MGGQSYETPYPVTKKDGSKVIWNWGSHSWEPYDPEAAAKKDAEKAALTSPNPGEGQSYGTESATSPGPSQGERDAATYQQNRRRSVAQRRRSNLSSDELFLPQPGSSLLTPRY